MKRVKENHKQHTSHSNLKGHKRKLGSGKAVLPPIVRKNDKAILEEVRQFIDEEKKKIKCSEGIYDEKRFTIYSSALDKIIDNTTSYKDLLADIKKEYDLCIGAIANGRRESTFITNKVKALSSLPTTIAGYNRRIMELKDKLEILNNANNDLEKRYDDMTQSLLESNEDIKEEKSVEEPVDHEEQRPIPGLTVQQWTDIDALKQALTRLDLATDELTRQQKSNYVLLSQKERSDEILDERISTHGKLQKDIKKMHMQNNRLKATQDAILQYRRKKAENPYFNLDMGQYIISKLTVQQQMEKKAFSTGIDSDMNFQEDLDYPGREKEAELMLEYIDRFNELFNDEEYDNAAVHAANSPRGVLRNMETLNRFCDVSVNYKGTPTPVLLYAIALMNSSTAQSHVADKQMSIVCTDWALRENRPDLVKHWATSGCITPSNEIAFSLVAYSESVPEYKTPCLVVAQQMFAEVNNHYEACMTLYRLHHLKALVDYAKETAEFTKNDYLELIRNCPDGNLVMSLCQGQNEKVEQGEQVYVRHTLPLRFDQAIYSMIKSEKANSEEVRQFLTGLKAGDWTSRATGEKISKNNTLHVVVYEETDGNTVEESVSKWPKIMKYCRENNLRDVALEIEAAIAVKKAIINALIAIGQDGKEEFDYYT